MNKNVRFLSSVLILCAFAGADVCAAPSVKILGSNTARVGSKPTVVKAPVADSSSINTQRLGSVRTKNTSAGTPVSINKVANSSDVSNGDESRFGMIKYVNLQSAPKTLPTYTTPGAQSGVTDADFATLSDRVSNLERDKISAGEGLVLENNTIFIDEDFADLPNRFNDLSYDIDDLSAEVDTKVSSEELNEFANGYYTKEEVDAKVENIVVGDTSGLFNGKQDIITDLGDIRSGAAAGKTAVQPDTLNTTLSGYATKGDLDSKLDAVALDDYATKDALDSKLDASALDDYATKDALNLKADASSLNNYLTTVNAAATYQPIGTYVSNPELPESSGDFMLVVNRDDEGGYTYSWKSVETAGTNTGSGDTGGGGWGFDDSDW